MKRGRKPGQKNKPSTINVSLKKLNEFFKENALIEVSAKYASLLSLEETVIEKQESLIKEEDLPEQKEAKESIQFEIIQPKKTVDKY